MHTLIYMNNKLKLILGAAALVVLIALSTWLYNTLKKDYKQAEKNPNSASQTEKTKATDFTVTDADGNAVSLSDFEGKPVVVNFWATWCGYCVEEMPHFDKLAKETDGEVVFMMVNATDGARETVELAKAFIEKQGLEFPVYFDVEQNAMYSYGVSSLPATLFVDKDGYISNARLGMMSEEDLREEIELMLPNE